jgi:hypothetical protein
MMKYEEALVIHCVPPGTGTPLCGIILEQPSYMYPKKFMETDVEQYGKLWEKCEVCMAHTDLPLHLLAAT